VQDLVIVSISVTRYIPSFRPPLSKGKSKIAFTRKYA
jgi:hypothetical protein